MTETINEVNLEEEILIYDPTSGIKFLVPLKSLIDEYRTYYDFKVYEQLGSNKKVAVWLKDKGLIENEKPKGRI